MIYKNNFWFYLYTYSDHNNNNKIFPVFGIHLLLFFLHIFQFYLFLFIYLMQAPQPPIDIKIVLGSEANCQNLVNIAVDFSDEKDHVKNLLEEKKITENFGKDLVLMFDFYVQQGKQKQAVQYFGKNAGNSPLQILFKHRPEEDLAEKIKFQIQQFAGFIRLSYRFFTNLENEDVLKANQILNYFETGGLRLQSHINFQLKGKISHNKKNRTNVKVDYAKFTMNSNAFCSQNLINSLTLMQQFSQQFEGIINNPFFELVKKSKIAKINLKMDSFRRISKYYNEVSQENKEPETKDFKYVNKGIFRQRADAFMIYNNQYLINVQAKFQSEDVFIRLIKVYSKFFEKLLNETFYEDD